MAIMVMDLHPGTPPKPLIRKGALQPYIADSTVGDASPRSY